MKNMFILQHLYLYLLLVLLLLTLHEHLLCTAYKLPSSLKRSTYHSLPGSYQNHGSSSILLHAVSSLDVNEISINQQNKQQLAIERRSWRRNIRKEVIHFALPALSTVLADPLMSVVDSICVGRTSTLQLASLGPALAVFNFCNYFFFFLNAASCVLVTQALAANQYEQASETLSTAVSLALGSGVFVGILLNNFAVNLVTATGCISELIPSAARYLQVRGMGQPVVLTSMVVQAGLLAQKDVFTPLQVISIACIFNILGDLILIPKLGAVGAAWATLFAQLISLPFMLTLSKRKKRLDIKLKIPKIPQLHQFFITAAPLFFFEMGMSICYMIIESLATQFTVTSTAAFQALWAPLSVLGFFTYPLKQAAQVFLPRINNHDNNDNHDDNIDSNDDNNDKNTVGGRLKTKEFLKVLSSISLQTGIFLSLAAFSLAQSPQLFTTDKTLYTTIKSFAPIVAIIFPLFGITQACEGTLAGIGDLKFLSYMQIGNVISSIGCLFLTKFFGLGIYSTWLVYLTFVMSRLLQSSIRLVSSLRLSTKEEMKTS